MQTGTALPVVQTDTALAVVQTDWGGGQEGCNYFHLQRFKIDSKQAQPSLMLLV